MRAVSEASLVIGLDCIARGAHVALSVRCNLPVMLGELPEILDWNASYHRDRTRFWADLYRAVNAGLARERLLEWDSLNVAGELMAWVYGVVILCSAA